MSLFKAFWRIIGKNKVAVAIYLVISLGIAIVFVVSGVNFSGLSDESTKDVTVGIVSGSGESVGGGDSASAGNGSNDGGDGLGAGLERYVRNNFNTSGVSNMSADTDDIKEALYSGATSYIIVIDGDEISDYQAPNNTSAYIAQNAINSYISAYRAIELLRPKISADEAAELTEKYLDVFVEIDNIGVSESDTEGLKDFYNIFVYGVLGSIVMGIGIAMMALNERKFYLRTSVAPISSRRRGFALFSAQACFGAIVCLLGVLLSIYFAGDARFSPAHIMFIVNSIPFVLSITAIGFLIGQAVKNETVFSGISTVLMLCVSFISGAFIPQEFLSDTVLKVSAMTPAYWYILNNNKIAGMDGYDRGALAVPIIVMLAFTAALVLAGILFTVIKSKKKLA